MTVWTSIAGLLLAVSLTASADPPGIQSRDGWLHLPGGPFWDYLPTAADFAPISGSIKPRVSPGENILLLISFSAKGDPDWWTEVRYVGRDSAGISLSQVSGRASRECVTTYSDLIKVQRDRSIVLAVTSAACRSIGTTPTEPRAIRLPLAPTSTKITLAGGFALIVSLSAVGDSDVSVVVRPPD
jgi:hypothetical protein